MATKPTNQPSQQYQPTLTNLVDYNSLTGSFLFRGNLPVLLESPYYYAYDAMNSQMQQIIGSLPPAAKAPPNFNLQNYNLLNINLLDNQGDYEDWSVVFQNFGAKVSLFPTTDWPPYSYIKPWKPETLLGNGQVIASATNSYNGNMVWWPFEPGFVEFEGGFLVNDLLTFAHTTLYNQLAKPTVIYVHCDSGVNRTGTFVVLYLLAYGSSMYGPVSTLEDAYNFADQMVPNNQAPVSTYFPMIQQYCLSMSDSSQLGCNYTPPPSQEESL